MAISMTGRRELGNCSCTRQEVSAVLTQTWRLGSSWELLTLSVYWKPERKKATDACRWWEEEERQHFSYLGSEPIGWWSLYLRDYPVTCSSHCSMCLPSLEMPPQKHPWVLFVNARHLLLQSVCHLIPTIMTITNIIDHIKHNWPSSAWSGRNEGILIRQLALWLSGYWNTGPHGTKTSLGVLWWGKEKPRIQGLDEGILSPVKGFQSDNLSDHLTGETGD